MKCRRNPLSVLAASMLATITLAMLCSLAVAQETESTSPAPPTAVTPAVAGTGTTDFVPLWTNGTGTLGNSVLFQSGTGSTAKVGINTTAPAATLDVNGAVNVRGSLNMATTGTATSTAGENSEPLDFNASVFNSSTAAAVPQKFQWQAEPVSNDTASPSAAMSLLYANGSATPAETGLKISSKGVITFASGQTFPGGGSFCIAVNGGFGPAFGTTYIAPNFIVPPENKCTAWSGYTKTATTVILNTNGAACLSTTGETLTVSVSSIDPPFAGTNPVGDYIQLTRASSTGTFSGGTDQGEFAGSANQITCTSSLLSLPDSHD